MTDFALTGNQILLGIIVLTLIIFGIVLFMKGRYKKRAEEGLASQHSDAAGSFDLDTFNQYPEANAFRNSGTILLFGIATALLIINMAFAWTNYPEVFTMPDGYFDIEDEIEMEPPRTAEPPPPPPPPPPPVIEEVPDEEIIEEQEFESQDVMEETQVEAPPTPDPVEEAPPPPPPPPPPPKEEKIFEVVEDKPRFPGCENIPSKEERQQCSDAELYKYIQKNLTYPAIARENGIDGKVYLKFVVNSKGKVEKVTLARGKNAALDKEAMRVVEKMADEITWIPGKQRGNPVSVYFMLPIKFQLE